MVRHDFPTSPRGLALFRALAPRVEIGRQAVADGVPAELVAGARMVARHDSVTNADTVTEHPPTAPRAGTVAVLSPPLEPH